MPTYLLLIKHSAPFVDPTLPAAQWLLSKEGQRRCVPLARALAEYAPTQVVTSREPKASETGQRVAELLQIPWTMASNLHEHERPQVGLVSRTDFETAVAGFFTRPGEQVFGAETAFQAQNRFEQALDVALASHPGQNLAIVAHGTVITLFVAHKTGVEPFSFWKKLGLPSFVVLALPDFKLERVVENVE